jgi:hypothetical protein
VKETNLYAFQKFLKIEESEQLSTPRKHMSSWKPVSLGEMKVFFGIVLIMGLNHLPRMKFYWSKNEMYENKRIKKSMKRERFYSILKFLHFSNKENLDTSDRLYNIRPLLEIISKEI